MFDIGWSELVLIGIVALIAIGPKELPGALRTLGQWMAKIRRMAAEFQGQFQDAMREAELDQIRKDMNEMAAKARDYAHFDPVEDVRRDIERTVGDLPPLDQPATPVLPADTTAPTLPPAEATAPPPAEPVPAAAPEPSAAPAPAEAKPEPGRAGA
ncbi:MAG: twin-arginine translocase subunit TatB [Hyphomicrobiales bacterium]|nr:twin-arginine translocase subunit TatB [Hyphomicrobiales bacterium]